LRCILLVAQADVINLWQLLFSLVFAMGKQSGLFRIIPRLARYYPGTIFYVDKWGNTPTLQTNRRCRAVEEDTKTSSSIALKAHGLDQQG